MLEFPAIIAGSPKISKPKRTSTRFFSSNPNELCDRENLLLQEKQAANTSDIIDEEIVAIVDKIIEYERISAEEQTPLVEVFSGP